MYNRRTLEERDGVPARRATAGSSKWADSRDRSRVREHDPGCPSGVRGPSGFGAHRCSPGAVPPATESIRRNRCGCDAARGRDSRARPRSPGRGERAPAGGSRLVAGRRSPAQAPLSKPGGICWHRAPQCHPGVGKKSHGGDDLSRRPRPRRSGPGCEPDRCRHPTRTGVYRRRRKGRRARHRGGHEPSGPHRRHRRAAVFLRHPPQSAIRWMLCGRSRSERQRRGRRGPRNRSVGDHHFRRRSGGDGCRSRCRNRRSQGAVQQRRGDLHRYRGSARLGPHRSERRREPGGGNPHRQHEPERRRGVRQRGGIPVLGDEHSQRHQRIARGRYRGLCRMRGAPLRPSAASARSLATPALSITSAGNTLS